MSSTRIAGISGAVLFVICLGVVLARSREGYSDGEAALAAVPKLKKGMTVPQLVNVLHPERMKRVSSWSSGSRPGPDGKPETIHALTPDRYIVITCESKQVVRPLPTGGIASYPEDRLHSWVVREGVAPREDITLGRYVEIAGLKLRY